MLENCQKIINHKKQEKKTIAMNNIGHKETTLAAINTLPAWQQKLWKTQKKDLAETYSLYGDTYPTNKKELGPFVELPDGTIPDFYMPKLRWKHHYDAAIDYWEAPFYDKALQTLNYFSKKIINAIREKDIKSAARFAGTMAHYFQDNACPGHAVDDTDLEIIKDLLPPPEHLKCAPFHPMMETSPIPFSIVSYTPKLYGTNVAEFSCNFIDRIVELNLNARKAVLPFFKSFYQNDEATATKLNMSICHFAAEVYADFLHSVACIAHEQSEKNSTASTVKKLAGTFPYRQTAWAGGNYSQVAPGELKGINLNNSYEAVPCSLSYKSGKTSQIKTISDALGATAYFEYEFRIPKKNYSKLTFDYGIHTDLKTLYPITFEVLCDNKCIFSDAKGSGDHASSASLDLPAKTEKIQLITNVADNIEIQRINNIPIVPTGHAVWANPTLIK